jgi:DNA modification methylase
MMNGTRNKSTALQVADLVDELKLPDIKPQTKIASLQRDRYLGLDAQFPISRVSVAVGMSSSFINRVCGKKKFLSVDDVLLLLDQDSFAETVVPRSLVLDFLLSSQPREGTDPSIAAGAEHVLLNGNVLDKLSTIPRQSVRCVVTSTPYWGLRIYKEPFFEKWADGEVCPFGHEQTPEGFVRHSTQVLAALFDVLTEDGSIWWNVMDTFNTRTQIRSSAAEALRAMQGGDARAWGDHECRRYSAGHSYLKDGEQCLIPMAIAERASKIGYYVKSVITWAKTSSLPEPQESRVSRNLEYVLHLTKARAPLFNKSIYRELPASLGGRNNGSETDKLSDVWTLPTSSGRDGHGAQFPIALPGRCIALSTMEGDTVLDPFVGAGNSGVAARSLRRRFIGIDVSQEYLAIAERRIAETREPLLDPVRAKTLDYRSEELFSGL